MASSSGGQRLNVSDGMKEEYFSRYYRIHGVSTCLHHDRTITVTLPLEGKPYDRGDFVKHVTDTVGTSALEACGPMAQGHILWQLTFTTVTSKDRFLSFGNFLIRGHEAALGGVRHGR